MSQATFVDAEVRVLVAVMAAGGGCGGAKLDVSRSPGTDEAVRSRGAVATGRGDAGGLGGERDGRRRGGADVYGRRIWIMRCLARRVAVASKAPLRASARRNTGRS